MTPLDQRIRAICMPDAGREPVLQAHIDTHRQVLQRRTQELAGSLLGRQEQADRLIGELTQDVEAISFLAPSQQQVTNLEETLHSLQSESQKLHRTLAQGHSDLQQRRTTTKQLQTTFNQLQATPHKPYYFEAPLNDFGRKTSLYISGQRS